MLQPKKKAVDPTKPAELGKPVNPPCQVTRVRFSPDGKILAAACTDGTVRRWDATGTEPAELPPLEGHNGWVGALAYAKDRLFSGDSWGRLIAWDLDGKKLWENESAHDGWLRMVAVSHDSRLIATCGKDGFVRVRDASDGKPAAETRHSSDVLAVAFTPDGKSLVYGDLFGAVHEFPLPGGKPSPRLEVKELYKLDRIQDVGGVRGLLFDPAGQTLLVAGAVPETGGFVQCKPLIVAFDHATGKRQWEWRGAASNEGYVTDVAWHPDGYVVATASGQPGQGKVFFLKPGEEKPYFIAPKPNVHSVAIHPGGTRIAASMTNANSAGNGRVKGKGGDYPANFSPIQFWRLPKKTD